MEIHINSYGMVLVYAKTKNKLFSLNFIIHRQKFGLSVYWNMSSSHSIPIKKKRNTVMYLHIKKIYDWWSIQSQNSAKHLHVWIECLCRTNIQEEYLSLTIYEEPFFNKNIYNWWSMQNWYSKRILMTDYPSGVNVEQEHRKVTVYVGPVFNMNTHDWLSMWNLCSTWELTTDWPCGANVHQEQLWLTDCAGTMFMLENMTSTGIMLYLVW